MRAIVLHAPGDYRLEERPVPVPGPGEALVRVASVGVCGSDLPRMLVKGAHRMPLITGHEFSGRIAGIGAGLDGWSEGELVAIPPLLPCRTCRQCLTGSFSRCTGYDYFGSRRDGAFAEYVAVPAGNLLKVPQDADPRAIAMTDPASIALHAVWKGGGLTVGQTGAVVGCGPIGLFAVQWLRMLGAREVIAVDVAPAKLELAREAGATAALPAGRADEAAGQADLVIEAVGRDATIDTAIRLAAPGGSVALIGIPVPDVTIPNRTFQTLLRQEVGLIGSWNSFGAPFPGRQWTESVAALADGRLRWEFMISHDLDLAELPGIFDRLGSGNFPYSKILFRP